MTRYVGPEMTLLPQDLGRALTLSRHIQCRWPIQSLIWKQKNEPCKAGATSNRPDTDGMRSHLSDESEDDENYDMVDEVDEELQ
jgi:hypothetical protein